MSAPIEAVLLDYGHTLIYFDERPHSALLGAYENVNRLLADTLEREVPVAQVMIEKVSQRVDAEIQRDYAAGREEEVEIAAIYGAALRDIGLELEPALIERVMELEQEGWLKSVHVGPDVVSTLEELRRRGLRLGIVSNAAYLPRLMNAQLAALGTPRSTGTRWPRSASSPPGRSSWVTVSGRMCRDQNRWACARS